MAKTKHVRELEKLVKQQNLTIQRMRRIKAKPLAAALGRRSSKTRELSVICTDSHGAYQDTQAVQTFLGDVKTLDPRRVYHLGDAVDCGGFLSSHEVIGVTPEMDITYEEDCGAANALLDGIQSNTRRGTDLTLLEGNHENRIRRWIAKQVLAKGKDAKFLNELMGVQATLNVKKRGIRYIERHKYYDGFGVSGTIRIGDSKIAAQHGEATSGPSACERQLQRLGYSVLFGHTHRLKTVYAEKLTSQIVAVNCGCLCQRRPVYGLTKTTDWMHGYVICVHDVNGFFTIPVPIVDGVSYLRKLL